MQNKPINSCSGDLHKSWKKNLYKLYKNIKANFDFIKLHKIVWLLTRN